MIGWVLFYLVLVGGFLALLMDGPLEAYARARDDAREYDEETQWELDYHARWNPLEDTDDAEPYGARR